MFNWRRFIDPEIVKILREFTCAHVWTASVV